MRAGLVVRASAGAVVVAAAAWAAWLGVGFRSAAPSALTAADALQHELLRRNLDLPGDPSLGAMYQDINARHFAGALPDIPVRWESELMAVGELAGRAFTLEGMFGHVAGRAIILLTPSLQHDMQALERVLCHEMVHAYLYTIGASETAHGDRFQTVLRRLSTEGAFEGLVASPGERARLRAWLDEEAVRLEGEEAALAELGRVMQRELADLEAAGLSVDSPDTASALTARREAYNERAAEANARVAQLQRDRETFLREVERYTLMIVYPDGLDTEGDEDIRLPDR